MATSVHDNFSISSSAFDEGEIIPVAYTCDHGDNNGISPPLEWKNAPSRTNGLLPSAMIGWRALYLQEKSLCLAELCNGNW